MLVVEFPKQSNRATKADGRCSVAIGTFGSSLFGMKEELAKNVCRPDTQNVAGHKEFRRAMGQAIGDGVRKAQRGPNWYDL